MLTNNTNNRELCAVISMKRKEKVPEAGGGRGWPLVNLMGGTEPGKIDLYPHYLGTFFRVT